MAEIDPAFIARQLERLVSDMAGLKDDMMVVMARLDRHARGGRSDGDHDSRRAR